MKKVFTIAFTSLFLFLFSATQGQNADILKSFINKNDFVLRSVQKNAIRLKDSSNEAVVKSILALQLISVQSFESNRELSKQAAYQARQEGTAFLQKNSTVPSETFKLTEKEKSFFGKQEPVSSPANHLSAAESKAIGDTDITDPSAFNSFITRL